jgi:hypothetical protein
LTIDIRTMRFKRAMRYRKVPETDVPTMLVHWCHPEEPFLTAPSTARSPKLRTTARRRTTVEWPSEKKYPTLSGRSPLWMSLRVVLSMAAMWSASKAWRIPSV